MGFNMTYMSRNTARHDDYLTCRDNLSALITRKAELKAAHSTALRALNLEIRAAEARLKRRKNTPPTQAEWEAELHAEAPATTDDTGFLVWETKFRRYLERSTGKHKTDKVWADGREQRLANYRMQLADGTLADPDTLMPETEDDETP